MYDIIIAPLDISAANTYAARTERSRIYMQKMMTITVAEAICKGLHKTSAPEKSVNLSKNWYARMLFVPTWNWHITRYPKTGRENQKL
jgi:hypothetical protein